MLHELSRTLDAAFDDSLNARGRSAAHVASGVCLIAGAVLASALVSYRQGPTDANPKERARLARLDKPDFQPERKSFAAVAPPMFLLLNLSAMRVWNAAPAPARTRALAFWGGLQALQALSALAGVKRQSVQLGTGLATMAAALAYAHEARKVDPPSAAIVTPFVSWMAFASLITEELWRLNKDRPGVH
jgi:tryptophan-rich sensory protein